MFRKPMRLEKWVAYDGALGVEVLQGSQDVQDDGDDSAVSHDSVFESAYADAVSDGDAQDETAEPSSFQSFDMLFSPLSSSISTDFEVDVNDYITVNASIKIPTGVDIDLQDGKKEFFPFWDDSDVAFSSGSSFWGIVPGKSFFFELGAPNDAAFTLYQWDDSLNATAFVKGYNLNVNNNHSGTWFAFDSGQVDADGNGIVIFKNIVQYGLGYSFWDVNGNFGNNTGGSAVFKYTADGGIRFLITDNGYTTAGNHVVTNLLSSIVYTPEPGSSHTEVDGFTLSVYYQRNYNYTSNPDLFGDDGNSIYDTGTPAGGLVVGAPIIPGPVIPSPDPDPDPTPTPDPDPDPEPDPGLDPDPDPAPEPILPPVVDNSPGDDGGDSGDMQGDDAIADVLVDGEGDAGAGGADALVYIYRRDEADEEFREGSRGVLEEDDTADTLIQMIETGSGEFSAVAAAAFELTRDIEAWMTSAREERLLLEQALGRLQEEYLSRPVNDWDGLRTVLREFFDSGNREMRVLNRVFDQMRQQMNEYKIFPPERRDGMLMQGLRELLDSASRRTLETTAFSRALNTVADTLRDARLGEIPPPGVDELSALFSRVYESARDQMLAKLARVDPMGKELASHTMEH